MFFSKKRAREESPENAISPADTLSSLISVAQKSDNEAKGRVKGNKNIISLRKRTLPLREVCAFVVGVHDCLSGHPAVSIGTVDGQLFLTVDATPGSPKGQQGLASASVRAKRIRATVNEQAQKEARISAVKAIEAALSESTQNSDKSTQLSDAQRAKATDILTVILRSGPNDAHSSIERIAFKTSNSQSSSLVLIVRYGSGTPVPLDSIVHALTTLHSSSTHTDTTTVSVPDGFIGTEDRLHSGTFTDHIPPPLSRYEEVTRAHGQRSITLVVGI